MSALSFSPKAGKNFPSMQLDRLHAEPVRTLSLNLDQFRGTHQAGGPTRPFNQYTSLTLRNDKAVRAVNHLTQPDGIHTAADWEFRIGEK
jgi:hypothetical protein